MSNVTAKDVLSLISGGGPNKIQVAGLGLKAQAVAQSIKADVAKKLNAFGYNWGAAVPTDLVKSILNGAERQQDEASGRVTREIQTSVRSQLLRYAPLAAIAALLAYLLWRNK